MRFFSQWREKINVRSFLPEMWWGIPFKGARCKWLWFCSCPATEYSLILTLSLLELFLTIFCDRSVGSSAVGNSFSSSLRVSSVTRAFGADGAFFPSFIIQASFQRPMRPGELSEQKSHPENDRVIKNRVNPRRGRLPSLRPRKLPGRNFSFGRPFPVLSEEENYRFRKLFSYLCVRSTRIIRTVFVSQAVEHSP